MQMHRFMTDFHVLVVYRIRQGCLTWVFPDPALYDVGDVFECGRVLLQHVVTQRDVVRQVGLVSQDLHGRHELLTRLLIAPFLRTTCVLCFYYYFWYHVNSVYTSDQCCQPTVKSTETSVFSMVETGRAVVQVLFPLFIFFKMLLKEKNSIVLVYQLKNLSLHFY